MTRRDVIAEAADKCIKELYSLAQPAVTWEQFVKENKEFNEKEKEYYSIPKENRIPYKDFMGPKPYEFYYLPDRVLKDIADSYIYAYKIDEYQNLPDTIDLLKSYCDEPIEEKWIEGDENNPGHRGYEHPDNLKKELQKIFDERILLDICEQYNKQYNLQTTGIESSVSKAYSKIFQDLFFKFLDMAGKFYNKSWYLNSFNMTIYLGASPNSNKEAVIENWKKYRNQDIEIDESKYNDDDNDE